MSCVIPYILCIESREDEKEFLSLEDEEMDADLESSTDDKKFNGSFIKIFNETWFKYIK